MPKNKKVRSEMNIPEKIKIGGTVYEVSEDTTLARDSSAMGMSCGNNCRIIIDNSLPKQNQESTLIHEVIEQINFKFELSLEHYKITTLEAALYQVIKDNPGIFKD